MYRRRRGTVLDFLIKRVFVPPLPSSSLIIRGIVARKKRREENGENWRKKEKRSLLTSLPTKRKFQTGNVREALMKLRRGPFLLFLLAGLSLLPSFFPPLWFLVRISPFSLQLLTTHKATFGDTWETVWQSSSKVPHTNHQGQTVLSWQIKIFPFFPTSQEYLPIFLIILPVCLHTVQCSRLDSQTKLCGVAVQYRVEYWVSSNQYYRYTLHNTRSYYRHRTWCVLINCW